MKIKKFFKDQKEKRIKKRAKRLANKHTYDQLCLREADISKKLNSPLDPETRKSLLDELKTISTAKKMIQDAAASKNEGAMWFLKTLGGLIASVLLMAISIWLPATNNKFADKARSCFERLVKH